MAILLPENQASVDVVAAVRLAERFPAAVSQDLFDALEEVLDYKLAPSSAMSSVHTERGKPTKSAELCLLARSWKDEDIGWHSKVS